MAQKPKIFESTRDMIFSLGAVIIIMVIVVLPTAMCSFDPGAPEQRPVHEADAQTFLELEARSANFPVVMPELPDGWVPNSARRITIADVPAPTIGVVTPDGGYLQLSQTSVGFDDAVRGFDTHVRDETNTETIDGHEVRTYTSPEDDVRDLWAIDDGATRLLLTGAASPEEFRTMITATVKAGPLPSADSPADSPADSGAHAGADSGSRPSTN